MSGPYKVGVAGLEGLVGPDAGVSCTGVGDESCKNWFQYLNAMGLLAFFIASGLGEGSVKGLACPDFVLLLCS